MILCFRSQLNNLQPVQVTELEAEFSKIEGQKAIPTRYIRSQQEKQAKIAAESANVEGISFARVLLLPFILLIV